MKGYNASLNIRIAANLINSKMLKMNLKQFNTFVNPSNNTLDLIFSDLNPIVITSSDPLMKNDPYHESSEIYLNIKINKTLLYNGKRKFNYNKSNYSMINNFLNQINWNSLAINNINTFTEKFYDVIYTSINKYTPTYILKDSKYPCWFSIVLIRKISEKKKYHKLSKMYNEPYDKNKFEELRSICKKLVSIDYKKYINSIENDLITNDRNFWSFVNSRKNEYPNNFYYDNKNTCDSNDIVNLFAEFFSNVFSETNLPDFQTNYNPIIDDIISSIIVTDEDVKRAINKLKEHNSAGPDGIPPIFIKKCMYNLIQPLKIMFNTSITSGIYPNKFKNSFILPIHKKGDKNNIRNYRPITILNSFAKIFDEIIYHYLFPYFLRFINEHQYGSVPGKSIVTNLLSYKEDILQSFYNNNYTISIYTDYKKAFDSINHKLLIQKLNFYGICGNFLNWFTSYFSNRTQQVKLCNFLSVKISVTSGIPQGSHLSSILFNIFINDVICNITSSSIKMYIDDLKLYK